MGKNKRGGSGAGGGSGGGQPRHMNAVERAAHRDYTARLGIRDTPTENSAGYLEHRSTTGRGASSYPHGSPPIGTTPAHITDIRRDTARQGFTQLVDNHDGAGPRPNTGPEFTVHERFHQHLDPRTGAVTRERTDRFMASLPLAPEEGTGYRMFPASVDDTARTVTAFDTADARDTTRNPPVSPRSQGRGS